MADEREPVGGPSSEPGEKRSPDLVFRPDERAIAKLRRVRVAALVGTAIMIAIGFTLIISYRPNVPKPVDRHIKASDTAFADSTASRLHDTMTVSPRAVSQPGLPVVAAHTAVAAIETLRGSAAERWVRADDLLPTEPVTRENGEEAAARLHRAVILCDSAKVELGEARQHAEVIRQAARRDSSGASYRLSALYVTVSRYVELLAADASDRALFYSTSESAVKAILAGDEAEAEIKQNVATSYQRKSEGRQRAIGRLEKAVREALAGVGSVR